METLWDLLERVSLLPEKNCLKHLLWALYFLKVYPKQGMGCWAIGLSASAVDPKTYHKCVWAFIDAVANVVDVAVSISYSQREDSMDCVHCSEDISTIHL